MLSFHLKFWRPAALLLLLLASLGTAPVGAQNRRPAHPENERMGRRSDFFRVKTPRMKYVRPDTTTIIETEEIHDESSDAAKSLRFNPAKKLSIVSEDTTTLNEGGQEIVEMSEEVLIDSSWVKVAGYYSIWDTHSINPYHVDGRRFRDSVNLKLTDATRERFSQMPMAATPITSGFGFRGYRWHFGVDLDLETGDSVKAVFDGVVRISKWDGSGYGNYLLMRHYNGLETLYGHLSKALVPVGTFVKAGQLIAYGGSTGHSSGSHLHFEVRYQGNPINPIQLYDFPDNKLRKDNFTITAALFNYYSQALRRGGGSLTGGRRSSGEGSSRRGAPRAARVVVSHRVRAGDTLSEVAEKYGVGLSTLKRLNPGVKTLQPGKKIRIK
ncbi:MAG: peptidoglycan DD-metalloendopeptidase family protein [Janthinobacterium lividum]